MTMDRVMARARLLFRTGLRHIATIEEHRQPMRLTWRYTIRIGSVSEVVEIPEAYIARTEDWSNLVASAVEVGCERAILRYRRRPYRYAWQRSRRLHRLPDPPSQSGTPQPPA